MDCGRFGKLIDSYLDGQLTGSLLAEFHAHRLACRRCSRVVNMLQAAGDVIAEDRCGEPKIRCDFTDRVMAALPTVQKPSRGVWLVRLTAGAAGLAAAAAITLAVFIGSQVPVTPNGTGSLMAGQPDYRENVAGVQGRMDSQDGEMPEGSTNVVHRSATPDGDLLTGRVVLHAVDRVVSWTEYTPATQENRPGQ